MYRQMRKRSLSLGALAEAFVICALCLVLVRSVSAKPDGQDENTDQSQNAASNRFLPPGAIGELAKINAEIDRTEEKTLQLINTNLDSMHQIQTLGKVELFDRTLSVDKNESCSTCHMAEVGYTGESQTLNLTTVAYPGSVRSRFSGRKPISYAYATLAPVLHYNATQHDFYGGNFWDMRATGARLQNSAAERAQGPPANPVEMGLPGTACVAYRLARGRYGSLFVKVWGSSIVAIIWPLDAEKICATPAGKGGVGPQLNLSSEDRTRANTIYDQFALAIAAYEGSTEVNAFSSKFDAYLAGTATLTPQEQHGYELVPRRVQGLGPETAV